MSINVIGDKLVSVSLVFFHVCNRIRIRHSEGLIPTEWPATFLLDSDSFLFIASDFSGIKNKIL